MSEEYIVTDATRFWIAHGSVVVHYGEESIGAHVCTGQPTLEKFADRAAWRIRLLVLGVDPDEAGA